MTRKLLSDVADYYTDKLREYGETPRGVDWNGEESQSLRFAQLCKVIDRGEGISINDLGCGYGALLQFLSDRFVEFAYCGIDLAPNMIEAANRRYGERAGTRFLAAAVPDEIADYGIASGIFNVRLHHSDAEWLNYIEESLDVLDQTSRRGFAFNCLTSYSDAEKMRPSLFYADPCHLFDICKQKYSRNVALLHDYGLYEFTIVVRKCL